MLGVKETCMFEGRKVEIARCRFWCICVCHVYEHLSHRILGNCEEELPKKPVGRLSVNCRPTHYRQFTDRLPTANRQATDSFPKCILVNSVNQVMSQITFEKVNACSRNFFLHCKWKGKFCIASHSLKVQNWSSALITRKITQVHSDCQKIACVASVSNWVTAQKLEREQKNGRGKAWEEKETLARKTHDSGKRPLKFHGSFLL